MKRRRSGGTVEKFPGVGLCHCEAKLTDLATIRVTADVKTQNMPADTGFVMVQCWGAAERLIGGASSQSVGPIGGTEDWKRISFDMPSSAWETPDRGFEATAESLKQLQRVQKVSNDLVAMHSGSWARMSASVARCSPKVVGASKWYCT